jgi:KDO2-lipid IV(A) lauroyltransferase
MTFLRRLNRRFLVRYRIEYALVAGMVTFVRCLSPSFAWNGARTLGRLIYRLGVRRRVILKNLSLAFPEMDERCRRELARKSVEHLACVLVDILLQRRMLNRRNVYDRCRVGEWGRAYLERHGEEGMRRRAHKVLFLTAHLGNWELAAGFFGLIGVPIAPVYRSPANPFLARLIHSVRLDSQGQFIERRGAIADMMEHFERGGNVGFLADQEALHGYDLPFFGHPARTHKTPAILAHDHGIKVFFGVMIRRGDFLRYEARGELIEYEPSKTAREERLRAITADLLHRLESYIREFPEQYFWMHRRWKQSGVHGPRPAGG